MSGYFWYKEFDNDERIKKEMNECLEQLTSKKREFAIYRFGLQEQEMHSREETAKYFSISIKTVRILECTVLREMKLRLPTVRSRTHLKEYLE